MGFDAGDDIGIDLGRISRDAEGAVAGVAPGAAGRPGQLSGRSSKSSDAELMQ